MDLASRSVRPMRRPSGCPAWARPPSRPCRCPTCRDTAAGQNPAALNQLIERGVRHDDNVGGLAALKPVRNGIRSCPHGRGCSNDSVPGRAFELRSEPIEAPVKAPEADLDFGRTYRAGEDQNLARSSKTVLAVRDAGLISKSLS